MIASWCGAKAGQRIRACGTLPGYCNASRGPSRPGRSCRSVGAWRQTCPVQVSSGLPTALSHTCALQLICAFLIRTAELQSAHCEAFVRGPERSLARVTRRDVSFTRRPALSRPPLASGPRHAGQAAELRLLPPRGSVASLPRPLYQPISPRPRWPIAREQQRPPARRAVSAFWILIASRTQLLKPPLPPPTEPARDRRPGRRHARLGERHPICSLRSNRDVRRTAPDTTGMACPKRARLARAGAEAAGGMPRAIR